MAGYSGHGTEIFVLKNTVTETVFEAQANSLYADAGNQTGYDGHTYNPTNWTKIGQIKDVSGPELSINDVDITSNDSKNNFKEYIPGLIEPGEVSFDIVYNPDDATHVGSSADSLEMMFETRKNRHFLLRLPVSDLNATDGKDFDQQHFVGFDAYVKSIGISSAMEDAVMASVSFKISGTVTIGVDTSA